MHISKIKEDVDIQADRKVKSLNNGGKLLKSQLAGACNVKNI